MEELILPYYLKAFSFCFIFCIVILFIYLNYVLNKNIYQSNNLITIQKGEGIESVLNNFENINKLEINIIKLYYLVLNQTYNKFIHYGEFNLNNAFSPINFIELITKPSNVLNKITIVEGWSQLELNNLLSQYFNDFYYIPYQDIIADTYYFNKNDDFKSFVNKLFNFKNDFFSKISNHDIFSSYTEDEIMIIGSLIEKEGLDYLDKMQISSVIFNRLDRKMKLQIDATVLFSITEGQYNLNRKLLISDLKIEHPYNTYLNKGLPPKPISYVGKNTINLILKNYKSEFLFYFFNNSLNKHIFSNTFEEHKKKLNEYRKSQ